MFTGIVEAVGRVVAIEAAGEKTRLRVEAPRVADGAPIGASIAVNGTCLTVVEATSKELVFEAVRETLDRTQVAKWNPRTEQLDTVLDAAADGAASNNGTKATPVFSADLFGDWREEVVWRTAGNDALLIYTTPHPTEHRFVTLMHNLQYRVQVAAQNAGYNQPPQPSFFLGAGMAPPAAPLLFYP